MNNKKINIGITINITDPNESIFSNGIRQNIILLRELYEKCDNVNKAFIINVNNKKIENGTGSPLEPYLEHIINLSEALEHCHLVVVCHGSITQSEYETFSQKGIRFVKQVLGSQQSIFAETVLFKPNENAFNIYFRNDKIKKIWISEHFYDNEKHFHETLYACEVKVAPYVWSPRFIEEYAAKTGLDYFYKPNVGKSKRISVFEPNINYVKNCIIPILISEKFYRQSPDSLKHSYIFNTKDLRSKKDFIQFCKDLDCHKDGKLFFQDGFAIMHCLYNFTDIVLSHQSGCALNYLYLDTAWYGYPLVHNSHMMQELGFYYPDNNVDVAIKHLQKITKSFDKSAEAYLKKSRKYCEKYFADNPEYIKQYTELIEEAMS